MPGTSGPDLLAARQYPWAFEQVVHLTCRRNVYG